MTCLSQGDTIQVIILTSNLDVCRYLLLTNKSAYTQCKKDTNSVVKSNCRFIYFYVFYGAVFHTLVSQPVNPEKSDGDCSCRALAGRFSICELSISLVTLMATIKCKVKTRNTAI